MPLSETNANNLSSLSSSQAEYIMGLDTSGLFGRISKSVIQSIAFNAGDLGGISIHNFKGKPKFITDTSYTLLETDTGQVLVFSNASNITVTMPNNLTANWTAAIVQDGNGQVILSPASGVTTLSYSSYDRTAGLGAALSLLVLSNSGANARYMIAGNGAAS